MSGRKKICLDEDLRDYMGKPAWHMEAWCYEDEVPPEPIVKFEALDPVEFAAEMSLLAEHFGKTDLSEPLIKRYFEIVRKKLNQSKFLEAVEAIYSQQLYWSQVINALTTYHENQHVPSQASYQPAKLDLAEGLAKGMK